MFPPLLSDRSPPPYLLSGSSEFQSLNYSGNSLQETIVKMQLMSFCGDKAAGNGEYGLLQRFGPPS
jgi:hypothetical protein